MNRQETQIHSNAWVVMTLNEKRGLAISVAPHFKMNGGTRVRLLDDNTGEVLASYTPWNGVRIGQ
jgi:hypothetical protein